MRSRVPAAVASAVGRRDSILIRLARPADGPALVRLQDLADRRLPDVPLLVAESDGELVAAAPVTGGDAVTDPFRVTLDVVELLRLRSAQLRAAA
jgi:hypothetical protein